MACINAHMEDVTGSCLSATISRIGNGINARIQNVMGSCLSATISRVGSGISARIQNFCSTLGVSVADSEKHIKVRCSIVCTLSEVVGYINVTPKDIQWITDDMGVFYDVESNVDWIIVTS